MLVAAGLALIVFSKIYDEESARLRMLVLDGLAPVFEVMSHPVQSASRGIAKIGQFLDTYEENERLRLEVERLRQWQDVARQLEITNQTLVHRLNLKTDALPSFVSGRVVGEGVGPFVRTLLLNVGTEDGIAKGYPVIDGLGVIGRIADTGNRVSRVVLLTDLNSRIPVTIEGSGQRAILAGDNSDSLQLMFLSKTADLAVGARIVTSGHGGVFPAGLTVGHVSTINGDQVTVTPATKLNTIEYASILIYQAPLASSLDATIEESGL